MEKKDLPDWILLSFILDLCHFNRYSLPLFSKIISKVEELIPQDCVDGLMSNV